MKLKRQGDVADGQDHLWPIFIISLKDSVERRRKIEKNLKSHSLNFQFIDAVDGRKGLDSAYDAMIDRDQALINLGRRMADAEYACALSHIAIYQRIVDANLEGAIILEDDAIIGPAFAKFYRARSYLRFDLIQLDHRDAYAPKLQREVELCPGISVIKAARNADLTTGYSISRRAALHMLRNALPISAPADWPCDVTAIPAMLSTPRIVDHPNAEESDSSIEAARRELTIVTPRIVGKKRFLRSSYWRQWWLKRTTRRIS